MPTSISVREIVHLFLVCTVFYTCASEGREQVRMTLLSRNHFQSEVDSQYECHLSKPDEDATVSSLRTSHTRACKDDFKTNCEASLLNRLNPDPPQPRRVSGNKNTDPLSYYEVDMINGNNNNTFGVFACNGTRLDKVETIISTTRMRSDAIIVPADDLFTNTVNINDTNVAISVKYIGSDDQPALRWRNNTQFRNDAKYFNTDTFTLDGPAQLYHKGIYESFIAGNRNAIEHALIILIVRACPANRWGPPTCEGICDSCYNGGICDEGTGNCVCPPGFMGRHCLTACGGNRYGHECKKKCSSDDQPNRCGGILFCLVHPFGCRCNTGWRGLDCSSSCDINTYGASCLQFCHCATGQCNRYTGECEGTDTSCEPGWTGSNCQECPNNRFGSNCSQECHCYKEYCNRETGLCNGRCLPQWIEQPSPYSCQTGLSHVTYTRGNPGEPLTLTCLATERSVGDLSDLSFVLSRREDELNNTGIVYRPEESVDSRTQKKFDVEAAQKGDVFYCQLWRNVKLLAVLNVTGAVYKLPVLSQAPKWLNESTNTSITIRWRAWDPDMDDGDPPVVAYIPYYRRNSSYEWIKGSSVPSNGTREFTAANLEEDTVYTFSVSVVREGENGEGQLSPLILAKTSPICQGRGKELLSQEECSNQMEDMRDKPSLLVLLLYSAVVALLIILLLVCFVCYKRRMNSSDRQALLFPKLSERTPVTPATRQCHEDPCTLSSTQDTIDLKPMDQGFSKEDHSFNRKLDISEGATASIEEGTMEEEYGAVAKSTTVAISGFYKYDLTTLEEEFKRLPRGRVHPWTVGQKEGNKPKNRFKDMYTYDHSRVILEKLEGDEHSDYYNASFILNHRGEKAYIAAQGPNAISCCDFWRMIWGQNISTVVMVTNLFKGKKERCKKYWPEDEGKSCQFDAIEVLWTKTQSSADCDLRTFQITRGGEQRDIQQFHFLSWPDSDVPDTTTPFMEFVKRTKMMQSHKRVPVLVHCSAGIGKTGVYIALSCLMEVLQTEAYIDVFSFVEQMRQNRINMVQSVKEYNFLYCCLIEFYLTKHTEMSARSLATKHLEDKLNIIQEEFKFLKRFNADEQMITDKMYEGLKPENAGRNRFHYMVPYDDCLPALLSSSKSVNRDNYINAAVVNRFRRKNGLILTQSPLPNTMEDFWRMVYDWKCPVIVMLNQIDPTDESCFPYWPEEGTLEYGFMSITFIMAESKDYIIHRLFDVSHKSSKTEVLSVHLLQLTDWPPDGSLWGVLESIKEVEALEQEFKVTAPTVVHCIDGIGRSGVFATVKSEVERLEETSCVNVFSTVKQLRESNPNVLHTWDDYHLCYQLINYKLQQEHEISV